MTGMARLHELLAEHLDEDAIDAETGTLAEDEVIVGIETDRGPCGTSHSSWLRAWNLPPTILNIVLFVVAAIAFTVVLTWVFNNTKGSLLIAVLVHTSFDVILATLNGLFPVPIVNDYGTNVPVLIGLGTLSLLLVAATEAG